MIQEIEMNALVKAGIFHSRTEVVKEALRLLFATRPQLNIEAAVQLYREGEVTPGRVAEIAGVTRWEFESLLLDRGVTRALTSDSTEELERQVERLRSGL